MDKIADLTKLIIAFRDAREWKKFHTPKDLAISLSIEAAELLEHFQWKNELQTNDYIKKHKDEIAEEIADVFNYLLILAHELEIDIVEVEKNKINKNRHKYPINKSKGNSKKYTEFKKI